MTLLWLINASSKLLGKIECDQQTNEDQELLRIIKPLHC